MSGRVVTIYVDGLVLCINDGEESRLCAEGKRRNGNNTSNDNQNVNAYDTKE